MYKNQEGYSDPAPGAALSNILREECQRDAESLATISRLEIKILEVTKDE